MAQALLDGARRVRGRRAIEERLSHRNADGGKWAATHGGRSYFQNTVSGAGATVSDPGASYVSGTFSPSGYWRTGAAGGPLRHADIADMEMGVYMTANGSEAAQWRITAVQCEVLYLPEQMEPPLMGRKVIPFPTPEPTPVFRGPFMGIFGAVAPPAAVRRRYGAVA